MSKILVVGTGLFGSALINILLFNKHEIYAYGTNAEQINDFKNGISVFKNKFYSKLKFASNDLEKIMENNYDIILLALPKIFLTDTVKKILSYNKCANTIFVSTVKGRSDIENISDIQLVHLFGPSYANEVYNFKTTIVNIVSKNESALKKVKKAFDNQYFHCVINRDLVGALMLPFLKNMGAIGMGMVYSLTDSINTRAWCFTRMLDEFKTLVKNNGGDVNSLTDYCGIGDIYLTCLHSDSRNFSFGCEVVKLGVQEAVKKNNSNVEGYQAYIDAKPLITDKKNGCVFLRAVYNILFNKGSTSELIDVIFASCK